jgi:hypothetical protein
MATKQQQAAATTDKPLSLAEQALQHSVYFNASTCEIKGDVVQLAAIWVSLTSPAAHEQYCTSSSTAQYCQQLQEKHFRYSLTIQCLLLPCVLFGVPCRGLVMGLSARY